ncbi:2-amino-4-hydroxy-6-hydroxymethyldihydropteridine diphosphokinase [Microbulbifer litoralis]|uniref:2-amino-4-hydroxy-6- hydroxymethyldihydropteridine diphosphokinase n=1 Tax=Microbulbifer litoralis TaxID=2933965 RepID=UPI0020282E28|nr:2-amino-4-hydroxy-6-hydroxymethyldihydropteridine diphosphokinase [Microbulbifer sp. GX H0434]
MARVFVGLGSNLSGPRQQLQSALASMAGIPHTALLHHSSFYCSAPVGPGEQPDYVNAAAELETDLPPLELLDRLQAIENAQGRERSVRWGARTLDLDILLFDRQRIDEPRLQVPHLRIAERNFVLQPLAELDPELTLPSGETIAELLQRCPQNRLQKI